MPQPNANIPSELAGEARELRALARCLVRNDDADDLTQDALVTALSQERKPRSLRPWLRQVLRNEYRASARRDSRRRRREESSWVPESSSAPDDEAHRVEMVGAVNEVLSELDEPYRVALQQRFFSELTAVDIARSEGCPAGTVRWRVQEGLRRVRRKLDERFDGRAQWVGGMMVIAGIPLPPPVPPSAPEGSTMTNTIVMKVLAAAAIVAGGVTFAAMSGSDGAEPAVKEAGNAKAEYHHASMQTAAGLDSEAAAVHAQDEPLLLSRHERLGADSSESSELAGEGNLLAAAGQRDGRANAAATDCFEGVALEPEQEIHVVLELEATESNTHKVTGVRFEEDRFNEVAGLQQCVANVMADSVITELPKDIATIMVTMYASKDGKVPDIQPPTIRGGGRDRVVDADAPDPEAIARKLGLSPRGASSPLISIVECSDYDCTYCKKARATVDQIVADYEDKVAVYRLHNPLPFHERADPAARAALAAGKQHKHWEMTDLLYDNLDKRSDADFVALAGELGLDTEQFKRDYASDETAATIEEHKQACKGNGASGTPAFFINGDILVGAQPYEKFKAIIDDELAAAK